MCGIIEDISTLERCFVKMFEGIDRLIIVYKEHELPLSERQALMAKIEEEKENEPSPEVSSQASKKTSRSKTMVKKLSLAERVQQAVNDYRAKEIKLAMQHNLIQKLS